MVHFTFERASGGDHNQCVCATSNLESIEISIHVVTSLGGFKLVISFS